jgi:hypothetical protein
MPGSPENKANKDCRACMGKKSKDREKRVKKAPESKTDVIVNRALPGAL